MKPYTELPYIFSESVSRVSVFLSVHILSPWLCLPLRGFAVYLSRQSNHLISLLIDDHCHQTSSCPITLVNSTHPPFSYRSKTTPPSVLSAELFCSPATASIIHSHLFCVQLLDLLMGRKPGLNWSIAFFFLMSTSSLLSVGKRVITRLHVPASIQPGSFKAHNLHPRCSEKDVILQDLLVSQ